MNAAPAMILSTHRFYDPMTDADAIRISVVVERRGEFWVRMAWPDSGKERRRLREQAEIAIQEAIETNEPPGEVKMTTAPFVL